MFINGVLNDGDSIGISQFPITMRKSLEDFKIGSDGYAFFHGLIDDIGVWNRACVAEIQQLYSKYNSSRHCDLSMKTL